MTNRTEKPRHGYDWAAMEFNPNDRRIDTAFSWDATPEGYLWWSDRFNDYNPATTKEAEDRFQEMKRLYAEDMAASLKTPDPHKTLRDEFAIAALSSISGDNYPDRDVATHAYAIADAMMKERNK